MKVFNLDFSNPRQKRDENTVVHRKWVIPPFNKALEPLKCFEKIKDEEKNLKNELSEATETKFEIDLEIIVWLKHREKQKQDQDVLAVTYIPLSALATENGRNWKVISTPKEVQKYGLLKANGRDGFPLFEVLKCDKNKIKWITKPDQCRPWAVVKNNKPDPLDADNILGYINLSIEHLEQDDSYGEKDKKLGDSKSSAKHLNGANQGRNGQLRSR